MIDPSKSAGTVLVSVLTDATSWNEDPLRPWFAAVIFVRLLRGESGFDIKQQALSVTFGDTEQGWRGVLLVYIIFRRRASANDAYDGACFECCSA